jgi:gamma-glutamyltranspeptidase/glutathione hydrolase
MQDRDEGRWPIGTVFRSRRSDVHARRGMVATSQPLAVQAGLEVLRSGGNAVDAAVATAAMLCVVEPVSTGLGGDCFAFVRPSRTARIHALNGSGRAPASASLTELCRLMYARMPRYTGHTVTVPGAVAAWCDLLERFGTVDLAELLEPAIAAAEDGFPVTEWISRSWERQVEKLLRSPDWESGDIVNGPPQESGRELLRDGRAPRPGELVCIPPLAATLRRIAAEGRDGFYRGEVAERISTHVQRYGGWLTAEDLAAHESEWVEPIGVAYRDLTLYECPPNGQGLIALLAARLADGFDLAGAPEADRVHLQIECVRLALADALPVLADPRFREVPAATLLSDAYVGRRRGAIDPRRAARHPRRGELPAGSDTVYLSVVDGEGNAVSLVQSLYVGTGTGLVAPGTGVSLQNRGAGFSLDPAHPNVLEPGKRPFHTILPAMTERGGELHASFGVMGGPMQPQGHLQVLSNLADFGMSPQEALDAPRWQIVSEDPRDLAPDPGGPVLVEEGLPAEVCDTLVDRGHRLRTVSGFDRLRMGGGQVILRDPSTGVLTGGSDPRKDGCAAGF